jgi:hypothetical protein
VPGHIRAARKRIIARCRGIAGVKPAVITSLPRLDLDRDSVFSVQWFMVMRTRLTSLVLLLMLTGSAFAGIPLHSNEQSCPMGGGMGDMDCCKAALLKSASHEVTAARLCCAVNCSNDGSSPSGGLRISPQSQPAVSDYQASAPIIPNSVLLTRHISLSHGPPSHSHPAYIRNLALLI